MKSGRMELSDKRISKAFGDFAYFTGDQALEHIGWLLDGVSVAKWKEFEFLLKTAKHFGGIVVFAYEGDKHQFASEVLRYTDIYDGAVTGVYRPMDNVIEVVVGRLSTWTWVENVFRHELVHLLQSATGTFETEDKNLLSDHTRRGVKMAEELRANPFGDSAQEAEAYAVMRNAKQLRDWVRELKRKPELTANWTRPTRQQAEILGKNLEPQKHCSTVDLEDK